MLYSIHPSRTRRGEVHLGVAVAVSLLLSLGLSFLLSWLGQPAHGHFTDEDVTLRVDGPYVDVTGIFNYVNDGRRTWRPDFVFPFTSRPSAFDLSGTLDEVEVKPLGMQFRGPVARYRFPPLRPGHRLSVRMRFRQRHLGMGVLYPAGDTRWWKQELDEARFTIQVPLDRKLSQCTYPIRKHQTVGKQRCYWIRMKDFNPEKDLMFHWTRVDAKEE